MLRFISVQALSIWDTIEWWLLYTALSLGDKVICSTPYTALYGNMSLYYCLSIFSWEIPILTVQECQLTISSTEYDCLNCSLDWWYCTITWLWHFYAWWERFVTLSLWFNLQGFISGGICSSGCCNRQVKSMILLWFFLCIPRRYWKLCYTHVHVI